MYPQKDPDGQKPSGSTSVPARGETVLMPDLSDADRALLDAWSLSWTYPGVRDSMLAEVTGLSPARQALRLVELLRSREALEYDPVTVRRLQRVRDGRQRSRSVRS